MASKIRRIYTYTDQQGNEQTVLINGTTAKDTDKKFQAFLSGVAAVPQEKKTPTLRQFIDEVYRPGFMVGLAETTIANYELYIRLYIVPFMGHMRIGEITVATIQNFYNWLTSASRHGRNKDLNRNSIIRIGGLASRMFKVAYEMKLIDDTPFKSTLLRVRSHRGGHHKALPDAEVSRIKREIPALQDTRQRLYMALLVYTGMRREEVLGLGWENIHLDENYGEVKRVVVFPNNAKAVVKDSPKTETSERTFIIPAASKSGRLRHPRRRGIQSRFLLHLSKNLLRCVQKVGYLRQIQQPRLAFYLRFTVERTGNEFRSGCRFAGTRRHQNGGNNLRPHPPRRRDETAASCGEFERLSVKEMHRLLHRTK